LALQIQQHDQALATARERLARAEAAVGTTQSPNLNELASSRLAAQSKLEAVLAEQNTRNAKISERTRTTEMLAQIRVELGDIEMQFKVVGHLAEIATGKNSANVTFQRYVLGALLDDVLRQASHRLKKMTSNRYTLQRFKDVSDRRSAAGLDIEVFDEQTGTARSANTLSGGEGFMASLSLALGLSDVVQSYAGGIQLDTLFIDEGFGTLDPESLDMAMKTLIELQQKGRLVGIISHVDELKQQLEHGIEIRFAAGGSSVRVGAIAAT
jgi:exonuclease SbcC